jgi:hypothetical protein
VVGGGKERREKRTIEEKALGSSGASREAQAGRRWVAAASTGTEQSLGVRLGFQPSRHIVCLLDLGPASPTKTAQTGHLVYWSTRTSNRLVNCN